MTRKRACDGPVYRLLDLEATVGDEDEDEEDGEDDDGASAGIPDFRVSILHLQLLDGFIQDEPSINPHYTPWRKMDETSDKEVGWHDLVASLEERHASGSKIKPTHHRDIAEDNCRNDRPLDPVIISSIENIIAHDYPFWRVRCKVTDWHISLKLIMADMYLLSSQAQRKRWLVFYVRWQRHGMRCEVPSYAAQ